MLECHAGRAGMGLLHGRCPAPCPLRPSLAEGLWAASLRGRFGFVRGLLPQPCCGEALGAWHSQPRLCQPLAQEWQSCLLGAGEGGLTLALPHSSSLQNTSTPPRAPGSWLGCSWGRSQQFCHGAVQPGPSWLQVCCSGLNRWHFPVLSTATKHSKTRRMMLRAPEALGAGAGSAD